MHYFVTAQNSLIYFLNRSYVHAPDLGRKNIFASELCSWITSVTWTWRLLMYSLWLLDTIDWLEREKRRKDEGQEEQKRGWLVECSKLCLFIGIRMDTCTIKKIHIERDPEYSRDIHRMFYKIKVDSIIRTDATRTSKTNTSRIRSFQKSRDYVRYIHWLWTYTWFYSDIG